MKRFFVIFVFMLFANGICIGAASIEKFAAASDISAVTVNGKPFKVHEQNHVPQWNAAPAGREARMVELKNLMVTGTLAVGFTLNTIDVVPAVQGAKISFFADRCCTIPVNLVGMPVKSGEQVYFIKVLTPDGSSYQVYTLSIMGLNIHNSAQYYKYGEPTFVADSYHTWLWAMQNAKPGQIIAITKTEQFLYKPGEDLIAPQVNNQQDFVLRSLSGCYNDFIIRGHGFHKGSYSRGVPGDVLFSVNGAKTKNIILYGITIQESTRHGFKLEGFGEDNIIFDNCRIIDANERAFKGSGPTVNGKLTRSKNITIINCLFENTQVPLASDHMDEFNGDYIGGIDVMNLSGLTISGNTFKNIIGKNKGARPPIFIWGQDGCENVVIENNLIVNCDQGIGIGNYSGNPAGNSIGGFYMNGCIIRNNFISINDRDLDILEINRSNDVKIYNNTLWRSNPSRRGIRDSHSPSIPSHNVSIINNIVCGSVSEFPRGNNIDIRHNIFSFNDPTGVAPGEGNITFNVHERFFINAVNGDFRLRPAATQAIKKGIPLPEVKTDFFGNPRGATPDIGAHQYTEN